MVVPLGRGAVPRLVLLNSMLRGTLGLRLGCVLAALGAVFGAACGAVLGWRAVLCLVALGAEVMLCLICNIARWGPQARR